MTIAVVIPYYQRETGHLEIALNSVMAQTYAGPIHVLVVDDSSPVQAMEDVQRVASRDGVTVEVIHQPNGGPAVARNRGLSALAADVTRVAFLDSDDTWTRDHLAHATQALDAGYDFFFSDHYQLGQAVGAFRRAGRIDPDLHPAIAGSDQLHAYVGDMFDQIVTGNVIGTSTVVYDLATLRDLRFDEAFYNAGEDYLFWIACARAGARFCFSTGIEARYGYGVNVYSGSGWGTEGHLRRIQNEMRYRKRLLDLVDNDAQRAFVKDKIAVLRNDFAKEVMHRAVHRKPLPLSVFKAQFALDPRSIVELPIELGQLVAQRIRG